MALPAWMAAALQPGSQPAQRGGHDELVSLLNPRAAEQLNKAKRLGRQVYAEHLSMWARSGNAEQQAAARRALADVT